jgi:selenocysteine-specific elongation factor
VRAGFLQALAANPLDTLTHIEARLIRDHKLSLTPPLHDHPFSENICEEAIKSLADEKKLIILGADCVHASWWQEQLSAVESAISVWHKQHPDLPGLPLDQLTKTLPDFPESLIDSLIKTLESRDYHRKGKAIASNSHTLSLPNHIKTQAESIIVKLDQSGLQPPSPAELTPSTQHSQALEFLIRSGQVIELDPKVIISATARDQAVTKVREHLEQIGQATASELRQHLDSTRKVVMPLLEHLDDLGITVRNENHRTLK